MRSALRSIVRSRAISLQVVVTLALGVGALVTAFMLVDAALWRLPPFRDADRVAMLYTTRSSPTQPFHRERWSYADLTALKGLTSSIATTANYSGSNLALTGMGEPEWLAGEIVAPAYFSILGAAPVIGRTFTESEDVIGASPVVILGHGLWRRRFAGEASVLGRTIFLRGMPFTVIGVMPAGFQGLTDQAQYWIPTVTAPLTSYAQYLKTNQHFISAVARLAPGVTIAQADNAVRLATARIHTANPAEPSDSAEVVSGTALALNAARIEPVTRRSLLMLLSAVGLLYLLACANAANLLVGRAITRRREAAIIAALGGGATRLWRHFLPEAIVLVVAGGMTGIALAGVASRFLNTPTNLWGPRNFYGSLAAFAKPELEPRSVAFAIALTLLTVLLVAWAPVVSVARIDILAGLRESSRGASGRTSTLRRPTLRGVMVALEAALAMLLLVGGGLMIDSFRRMRQTDLGVDSERVLTFWLRPNEVLVPSSEAPAFVSRVLSEIASAPGVTAVTVDGGAPASGSARSTLFIAGRETRRDQAPPVLRHYIAPDHFRVLGVPLLRGRTFDDRDVAGSPRVAIISASAATRFWPNQDPIGQRVWFGGGSSFSEPDSSAEIVGIVADVVNEPLDVSPNPSSFYTPYKQFTYASRMVLVRTNGDPLTALTGIRDAVRRVDPDLPLVELQTLDALIARSWARQRFDAVLFGAFAILALLLASSGIYAVVAYTVTQRTREMGIRMALGAQTSSILSLVIRQGMTLPVIGLVAGIIAALLLTRFLQSALYEVRATDPVVFALSVVILAFVSLLACLSPARRATRQDPLIALRSE